MVSQFQEVIFFWISESQTASVRDTPRSTGRTLWREGWLVRRLRHELEVLGYDLADSFDLLSASDGETIQAPGLRGKRPVVVEIQNERIQDACTFRVRIP